MNHLDFLTLSDYWITQEDAPSIEEHLFACAECSQRLEWIARMAKGVRDVVRGGDLAWVLTPEFVARLAEEGLRVRTYAPLNGGEVQCTVTAKDDLLMGRLRSDLVGVSRVDVILSRADGSQFRLEDIAFRPAANTEVVFNQPMSQARAMDSDQLVITLVSVEAASERTIGQFTFHHSRTAE